MTRIFHRASSSGIGFHVFLGCLTVLAAWNAVPRLYVFGFLGALLTACLFRALVHFAFARCDPPPEQLLWWRRVFGLGAVATAVVWAMGEWVFLDSDLPVLRFLILIELAGISAGAARALATEPWCSRAFILTTLGTLTLKFTLMPISGRWMLAAITIIYIIYLLGMSRGEYANSIRIHRLIFENEELVKTLSAAKASAEAACVAKSGFLAMMSHEIRTPMNGVIGMLQELQSTSLTATQKDQVEVANNSAETLLRLLNDILDFSKIESGKLEFESICFSPGAAANEVIALLRRHALEKRIDATVNVSPDLPPWLLGDPVRFKQVLLNLVGNAIKFTERGEVALGIHVTETTSSTARLRFAVRDTGIGMDAQTRARLFSVFSQADSSTTRRFGGSGLGLAISQRLVKTMGGEITVSSTHGEGSEFCFELVFPIAQRVADAIPQSRSRVFEKLSGRVLVVEDDRVNQKVISLMLARFGISCELVDNGLAAVQRVTSEDWDLVLMDMQMPEVDGLEATRRIRRHPCNQMPIVALTANAMAEDRVACEAAGMNAFLTKPVREGELRACLEIWLRANRPATAPKAATLVSKPA
jgi:signal transduction histidine kinase/CheY-like chemotaxis protein